MIIRFKKICNACHAILTVKATSIKGMDDLWDVHAKCTICGWKWHSDFNGYKIENAGNRRSLINGIIKAMSLPKASVLRYRHTI
jgi:hypothetical protein